MQRILATEDDELDCEQVAELMARYVDMHAAGESAPRMLAKVDQHLTQCTACAEVYETLLELALLEAQDAMPDADTLLDRILSGAPDRSAAARPVTGAPSLTTLANVDAERPRPTVDYGRGPGTPMPTVPPRLSGMVGRAALGWWAAAAALIAAVVLGAWAQSRTSEAARLRGDLDFIAHAEQVIQMHGTASDPDATGHVFMGDGGGRVLLVIDSLNPLPADRVYQLWVTTETEDVLSVGTFTVGPDGEGRIWADLRPTPTTLASMFITPEPAGGSPHPSSDAVCAWGDSL